MKKCCFIILYFGKLPNYFSLFLKSCKWNPDFNWLVITDDNQKYEYPENVFVENISFYDMQKLINSKFDFQISLSSPYKLCDYKPAYGYIFEDYLLDYKFWGHCDIDTLMGNLSNFISEDILEFNDKVFCLGHMTLYKNTWSNNRLFMSDYKGQSLYKDVFSNDAICWFDEEWKDDYNVNQIFLTQGKRVYKKDFSLNFEMLPSQFIRTKYVGIHTQDCPHGYQVEKYKDALYLWEKGNLYRLFILNNQLCREDFSYMHLQQRKMKYTTSIADNDTIKIMPNIFCSLEVNSVTINNFNTIKRHPNSLQSLSIQLNSKWKKLKNKVSKILD